MTPAQKLRKSASAKGHSIPIVDCHILGAHTREFILDEVRYPFLRNYGVQMLGITSADQSYQVIRSASPFELFIVTHRGSGQVYLKERWQKINSNQGIILEAGEAQGLRSDGASEWELTWLLLQPDTLKSLSGAKLKSRVFTVDAYPIEMQMRNLSHEATNSRDPYAMQLCVEAVVHACKRLNPYPENSGRLQKLWNEISRDLARKWKLTDLAKASHLSIDRLRCLSLEETGKAPMQHLRDLRIRRAVDLVITTNLSIERIGELTGFQSIFAFSRCFRALTGTSPRSYRRSKMEEKPETVSMAASFWPSSQSERRKIILHNWSMPYELSTTAKAAQWFPLSLAARANRSFTKPPNIWFKEDQPLHITSGRQLIHGVPFEILDEKVHSRTAIVSGLPLAEAGKAAQIQLSVGQRCQALYFLHGCAWVTTRENIGEYRIRCRYGRVHVIPMIPSAVHDPSDKALPANIQDWWPSFPQFRRRQARKVIVTRNGDPLDYERYLYTLEWVCPEITPIENIEFVPNKKTHCIFGIIAITALLAVKKQV